MLNIKSIILTLYLLFLFFIKKELSNFQFIKKIDRKIYFNVLIIYVPRLNAFN